MRLRVLAFLFLILPALTAQADWRESAQTALHVLDYVGVDYAGSVKGGKVISADEYKEQLDFAEQAVTLIGALPEKPTQQRLVAEAKSLVRLIADKADPEAVT